MTERSIFVETKRLTASERESLMRLAVMVSIAHEVPQHLEQRCRLVPGAKRDLAMIRAKSDALLRRFAESIPEEQRAVLDRNIAMCSYHVGAKRPGGSWRDEENFGLWLPFGVIAVLVQGLHDKCALCSLDRAQRRACALRKVLDIIPNDIKERSDDDCPYFTVI